MAKLIFDIETIGEDFELLDQTTKESLTHWIERESENEIEYQKSLEDIKNRMGFSPLTGEIVAIGVLDAEKNKGAVYYQAPGEVYEEFIEDSVKFKQMSEKDMLERFWKLVEHFDEFVSFNGRAFDVPYLIIRSAINGIKPSKNLLGHRYLSSQPRNARHVDLLDQLTFYGTVRKKGNLHLWSRAFGIRSPKAEGVTGEDVGKLFKEKRFKDIARYNVGDLRATRELFLNWEKYIK